MKFLVTGAAGFIGSHICTELLARGNKVWGMDDLSKGRLENIAHLLSSSSFNFIQGSLAQKEILFELISKVEVIYHLAAVVGVKRYVEDPAKVIEVNVCQTLELLQAAWKLGKKIIFASTSEIYGKNNKVPFREDADRVYGPSFADRWCYAVSKSAAEHLCLHYARRGLPVVVVRYFNVYGPRAESSPYGGVATRFIKQALNNEPLTVHGDGSQTRCFTYVDDIVQGTLEAGARPEAEGRFFNLGSRRETSILELAQLILAVSGKKGKILFQPHEEFYGPNYEDIPRRVPDLDAAEKILSFRPKVSLEEGLEKTIKWFHEKML